MRQLSILIITLFLTIGAGAQPYGSATRARDMAIKTNSDLPNPVVRLGYIKEDNATLQQFMDNLEVGLLPAGYQDSRIISYSITLLPAKQDVRTSDIIKGSKLPREVFNKLDMHTLKPGDKIIFENIRLEDTRHAFRYVDAVTVTIR